MPQKHTDRMICFLFLPMYASEFALFFFLSMYLSTRSSLHYELPLISNLLPMFLPCTFLLSYTRDTTSGWCCNTAFPVPFPRSTKHGPWSKRSLFLALWMNSSSHLEMWHHFLCICPDGMRFAWNSITVSCYLTILDSNILQGTLHSKRP